MAWTDRVTTTTNQKIMPWVVDTILNSNVLAQRLIRKAKKWNGETQKFPIKYQANSTGQSFAGFDTFSTSAVQTRVNLAFTPRFYQITCSLPLDELAANATEEKVLDLMATELKSSAQDMASDIGTLLYLNGTGNGDKDFNGLGSIVDDGTGVAVYGGLNRNTYTTLQSTITASGGTLTLARMSTLYNAVTSGSQKPTIGICTEAVFNLYESLLQPQERIAKDVSLLKGRNVGLNAGEGLIGGTGFTGLFFKGFPILADEKCDVNALYFLNEDYLDFYALPVPMTEPIKYKSVDVKGNDYSEVLGLGFSWTGFIKALNAASVVSHIFLGGDFITDNPKRHGKLTGITTV